jgi:hypothetical protein
MNTTKITKKIDFDSLAELRDLVDRLTLTIKLTDQVIIWENNVPDDYIRGVLIDAFAECMDGIDVVGRILSDIEGCDPKSLFKQSLYEMNAKNSKLKEIKV